MMQEDEIKKGETYANKSGEMRDVVSIHGGTVRYIPTENDFPWTKKESLKYFAGWAHRRVEKEELKRLLGDDK